MQKKTIAAKTICKRKTTTADDEDDNNSSNINTRRTTDHVSHLILHPEKKYKNRFARRLETISAWCAIHNYRRRLSALFWIVARTLARMPEEDGTGVGKCVDRHELRIRRTYPGSVKRSTKQGRGDVARMVKAAN